MKLSLPLVPKLHLGTHLSAKLGFVGATEGSRRRPCAGSRQRLNKKDRHPERSEAKRALSSQRARPSAVEGPCRFNREVFTTDLSPFMRCSSRCLCPKAPAGLATHFAKHRRSFSFGSVGRCGKTNFLFAFAQDDGALNLPFVPRMRP